MTHLLLGFDVGGEVANSRLNPFGEFNCLTVLLELMESTPPSVAAGKQSLGLGANQERGAGHCEAPETAARLVFELAANERTRGPAIELLQNWPPGAPAPAQRLPLLLSDALAASPPAEIEPGSAGSRRAASAHYRSWIMRTAALVLDATAPPFGSFPAASVDDLPPIAGELTRNILSLGLDGDGEGVTSNANASDVERPRMAALELLATLPPPPGTRRRLRTRAGGRGGARVRQARSVIPRRFGVAVGAACSRNVIRPASVRLWGCVGGDGAW